MSFDPAILGPIAQVVWIDLLLSADNAVVIALACR
jgi:predicted tellurium resistance membrane protein TerC